MKMFNLLTAVVIFFSAAACTTVTPSVTLPTQTMAPAATSTAELSSTPFALPSTVATATNTATSLPPTSTVAPTATVPPTATTQPTATADTRLLPAQWKQWPIVPVVTGRGLEIYRRGLALGNSPHSFSKVADCQGIREVLLGVYDLPGYYKLSPEHASLQETIDWFSGSFNRNGEATMGGFNARAVLQPQFADPAACLPGETPIGCEQRVHHPSIVLINLEFGYDGRTTANYVQYMHTIIDFYISKGVLPILATKADNFEGDNSLNLATATLAYEYDLPLWNWWLAAQPMYNHGLDITRPDGFHISVDAWQVRSSTALQAIDSVWRGVRDAQPLSDTTAATTPTAVPPAGPEPSLDLSLSAAYSSGQALFGLAQRKGEGYEYLGVYTFDPNPKTANPLQQILGAGWNLQAVAPDGKSILVNYGSELWDLRLDGATPYLLTQSLAQGRGRSVLWAPNGKSVIFAGDAASGNALYEVTPGSSDPPHPLSGRGTDAIELVYVQPGPEMTIYYLVGNCSAPGICDTGSLTAITGQNLSSLPGEIHPAISAISANNTTLGYSLAYSFLNEKDRTVLAVTTLDRTRLWSPLPDGYTLDTTWSPSGRWLAALLLERSDYSGKAGPLRGFLLNPLTLDKVELPAMGGMSARLAWSADGAHLLVIATEPLNLRNTDFDKGYRLNLYSISPATGQSTQLDGKISPTGQEYLFATNIAWIP